VAKREVSRRETFHPAHAVLPPPHVWIFKTRYDGATARLDPHDRRSKSD
jgi:hypothetical protein